MIFIDAMHVKIHDGQVANRPIYVALALPCERWTMRWKPAMNAFEIAFDG